MDDADWARLLAAARAVRGHAHARYSGFAVGAAVVAGVAGQPVTPCGGCRQRLREFAADDTPVWSADLHKVQARHTLGELLPASFGPQHLPRDAD